MEESIFTLQPNLSPDTAKCVASHVAAKFHVYDVNNLATRRYRDGNSALHLAEVPEVADFLIHSLGMDVDVRNETTGDTPLHCHCLNNRLSLVKYMCEHHADIDIENKEGKNVLCLAEEKELTQVVNFLKGM